ncbi:DEAD-box ATP-dependent RNA helicase 36 isoform X2 [Phoenix dactylifera]|uniref:DEAD-box ATP-dependent RNA helicase 36 isoform X2 n=1 Tax=Phoenix dactylifera TaxID=42345 RepID=A0A8B7CP97_PHODC|nr:DEAD-box ATP-dependent RNA helicase 36 isoform X2 [Phoenix dactylifera]
MVETEPSSHAYQLSSLGETLPPMGDSESQPSSEKPFRLFSTKPKPPTKAPPPPPPPQLFNSASIDTDRGDPDAGTGPVSFSELGLFQWGVDTCRELGMRRPTPVQRRCIPRILAGDDVLGIAQTGSGKTAAFALPILHRLAEDPYGVFALVLTPTRELACQLAEQFRALGSPLNVRCTLIVGGMDMIGQARALVQRPHIVVATPGRIKVLLEEDPDIPAAFSKTKFLVLDEADRVLDVGFEEELRVIFQCLPKNRQTLLFSATMTNELQALLEISANRSYFFEAYEGFRTVDSLQQQYIFTPKNLKDLYLFHVLSKMEEEGTRSAIVFVSTCRTCHLLSLLLEELDQAAVALHSHKSQSLRLSALNRFKSGQVPVLLATDVASRGLDIQTVDLVINYDIPRYPRDYVHRVGRTARAGRGGLSISFVTQNDVDLVHEIEAVIGKQLDKSEYEEKVVLEDITKVYKARRVANMKMMDDGFEERAEARKAQKLRTLAAKGLLKKRKR